MKKKLILSLVLIAVAALIAGYFIFQSRKARFEAPRTEGQSIQFHVGKEATLMGVVNNLFHYGFIKDENSFKYALENSEDSTPGNEDSIRIGSNTIDTQSTYEISETMDTWELASVLLNKARYDDCSHGCPGMFYPELLPGGDLAPGADGIYKWVETYKDCIKAKSQLSSEQYYEETGIRRCVSPDGREFTEGQEGWSDKPSP